MSVLTRTKDHTHTKTFPLPTTHCDNRIVTTLVPKPTWWHPSFHVQNIRGSLEYARDHKSARATHSHAVPHSYMTGVESRSDLKSKTTRIRKTNRSTENAPNFTDLVCGARIADKSQLGGNAGISNAHAQQRWSCPSLWEIRESRANVRIHGGWNNHSNVDPNR